MINVNREEKRVNSKERKGREKKLEIMEEVQERRGGLEKGENNGLSYACCTSVFSNEFTSDWLYVLTESITVDRKPPVWSSLASSLARTSSVTRTSVLMTSLITSLTCRWAQHVAQ